LSLRRARLIERELQRAEVKALSIEVIGKARAIARAAKTRRGRARNRFVEIRSVESGGALLRACPLRPCQT
jgi:outer membrane protein OmpA-like peptidoglycan-associated protein